MSHRYFTQDISGERARINGSDAGHLARVLRAQVGDTLILCDGIGFDYTACIESVDPQEVLLRVTDRRPSEAEPTLWVGVYLGYSKGERLEWAIQKSVELGASHIVPFFSANCVVKPKKEEEKNKRYNRIAQEAAKQSGRGVLPTVALPLPFDEMIRQAAGEQQALFFYEMGGAPLRRVFKGANRVSVITGPEGGFTPEEARAAGEAGCETVGLGPRILRCETAPAAVLAALMTLSGNLE